MFGSKFKHLAPYKKVTSLLPTPPIVKGITETMEDTMNTKRYSVTELVMPNASSNRNTHSNCIACNKAE